MSDHAGENSHRVRLQNAVLALKRLQAQVEALEAAKREPIAIIGMGCRLPGGADTPDAFWQLLHDGVDTAGALPADRWDVEPLLDTRPYTPGKMFTRYGNFLRDIGSFDPQFFGIAPREASSLDPQQRMLLEVSWEALEHAGQAPDALAGTRTGVFVGVSVDDYAQFHLRSGDYARIDAYTCSGAGLCFGAGRVSYVLGLHGPCMTVDTACSSALTSIHLASQSLRAGECDVALAGGINLILTPEVTIGMSALRALSPDGRSKAFDASADGFGRGEACGVIVLKRLSDAMASHDRILAVIRGSAINHDGASGGLMVPNGTAQETLLRQALVRAGVRPADVEYVDAHGTGTALGDPIELEALSAVMGEGRPADRPLVVGSVKTNVGHPEAASGVVGVIKVALAFQYEVIPPHLHFRQPSPHIPWDRLPIVIPTTPVPWPAGTDKKRIAGVSAFGMSGTNVHVVLEEPPMVPRHAPADERPLHLLRLSAKTPTALRDMAARLDHQLGARDDLTLPDVCFTANVGRAHFAHRAAILAESVGDARTRLAALASGQAVPGVWSRQLERGERPKVAFLFTGQGSQYVGMGRQLYSTQPTFRRALDRCDELLRPHLDRSLLSVLFADPHDSSWLDQTAYTQPCLFALEYALAQLWRSWGVEPMAVLGYSVGEYAAACVAGMFDLEDGLRLIAERGRLMQALPPDGMMAAIFASEADVAPALERYASEVAIAARNGPTETVISGSRRVVQVLLDSFTAAGVTVQPLSVSHAFHSPLLEPILDEFARIAAQVPHQVPRIRLVSNLTGRLISAADEIGGGYWRRHAREVVQFVAGLECLYAEGVRLFVEVGPRPTLAAIGRRVIPDAEAIWLPSLRKDQDEWRQMLHSLALLHLHGVGVDWAGFDRDYQRRRVSLPTYPFERTRFWTARPRPPLSMSGIVDGPDSRSENRIHPLLHRQLSMPLRERVFETTIDAESLPFLADHRVRGRIVFPATGYLEMLLAAAREVFGEGACALEAVQFEDALVLPEGRRSTVQVVLTPESDGVMRFAICTRDDDEGSAQPTWRTLVSGMLRAGSLTETGSDALSSLQARCPHELSVDDYYRRLAGLGLEYGDSFRGLQCIQRGDAEAVASVALPERVADQAAAYQYHPALLDAALQIMGACVSEEATGSRSYMPVSIDRMTLLRRPGPRVWSHATTRPGSDGTSAAGDVRLLDPAGEVLAVVQGLRVRQVSTDADTAIRRELGRPLYAVQWRPQDRAESRSLSPGRWLLVADRSGMAVALSGQLERSGASCVIAQPGVEDGEVLAADIASDEYRGVVYLRALDASVSPGMNGLDVQEAALEACAGALRVVHALASVPADRKPRLWLVTRGAQPVEAGREVAPAQAPLWGLGSTIALEHPDLLCTLVDVDPSDGADVVSALAAELASGDLENRIGWRGGTRYVARLVSRVGPPAAGAEEPVEQLEQLQAGVLDSLAWRPTTRQAPGSEEIAVRVRATALNFRDVLNALGMYPGDAGPLGDECAGTVVAVGPGVTSHAVGDEVVALVSGSFRTHVTATSAFVVPRPQELPPGAAAALPIAYLTALYGLRHLARLAPGERVLIHAATGGVGLAAVYVARALGAEIFATAGSAEKRAFLAARGVQHVMDSRSLAFADEIRERTGGQGVEVVLNSLSGDFIGASLRVLAPRGRFVEIGRRGIWTPEQVAAAHPTAEYHPFHLATVMATDPVLVRALMTEIVTDVAAGRLPRLPHREFASADVLPAFRHMAQARHIGKIVVTPARRFEVRSDRTYLISGGLGALGIRVAEWLVERGARELVLVGRRAPSVTTQEHLRQIEALGARVTVAAVDVARQEDVARLMAAVEASMPPLGGVIHAAGVIDDGVLLHQDRSRLAHVMAPKVAGAWNLHTLTQRHPLDFFVLFSSIVAIAGTAGQGNYAAANAFLDALAQYRRSTGLPALSINWGAWAETGMAAQLSGRDQRRWIDQGIILIPPERGLAAMEQLLADATVQASVVPMLWPTFLEQFAPGAEPCLYAEVPRGVLPTRAAPSRPALLEHVLAAAANRRRPLLDAHVRDHVARALGLARADTIDPQQPLGELGLDSLMAVEIRNVLGVQVGQVLPVSLLYDYPTVDALTGFLARLIPGLESGTPAEAVPADDRQRIAALQQVSETEAEELLLKELQALESLS
jgi:acyl transferase domain-containing protein/acyl carrier protein